LGEKKEVKLDAENEEQQRCGEAVSEDGQG
jgi:hypothetical protein